MGFINDFFSLFGFSSRDFEHDVTLSLTTSTLPRKAAATKQQRPRAYMPTEIVIDILEAAYYNEYLEPDTEFLRNCALVSKDWSFVAQKLLFRKVTLRTQTAYNAFHRAVDRATQRGCLLGDAVLRMRVVLDDNQPSRLAQHSFAQAVTLCPNLYELNVSLFGQGAPGQDIIGSPDQQRMKRHAPSFDEETLSLLSSGPSITALQFNNWSDNSGSLSQLLDVWPSLKSLMISGTPPALPSPSPEPFPCALEEIRMNFQTAPSTDFLKWLLHNSTDSLRIVELEREPTRELLDYLVEEHGTTLASLALPACGTRIGTSALAHCTGLRELRLGNAWAAPGMYRALPATLEHLALGVDKRTPLRVVAAMIKQSEALNAVTIHLWEDVESYPDLPSLQIACVMQGVDLRVMKDISAFRTTTRGDPVPTSSFPRTTCLDNQRFMHSRSN